MQVKISFNIIAKIITLLYVLQYSVVSSGQFVDKKKTVVGKIIFSDAPFSNSSAGAKKSFHSGESIYGRLETNGRKFNEFLEVPDSFKNSTYPAWYMYYIVRVYKKGKFIGSSVGKPTVWKMENVNWNTTSLNLDVLPKTEMASTMMIHEGMDEDAYPPTTAPLYGLIDDINFPEGGTYQVKVEVFDQTLNDWGKPDPAEKWPCFEGEFDFTFNMADIAKLKQNEKEINGIFSKQHAREVSEVKAARNAERQKEYDEKSAKEKAEQQERNKKDMDEFWKKRQAAIEAKPMPPEWSAKSHALVGGITIEEVKRGFLDGCSGCQIKKIYVAPPGAGIWSVAMNAFGIPIKKYLNQEIIVFFKNGEKCEVSNIFFERKYEGNGRYGPIVQSSDSQEPLPCAKMK